jgi:hypothetical protein
MSSLPPTLRRCPGWDGNAHMLPATLEHFYRSAREGLSGYCRCCMSAYNKHKLVQDRLAREHRRSMFGVA